MEEAELSPTMVRDDAARNGAADSSPSVRAPSAARRIGRVLIYGINFSPEPIGVGRYTGEIAEFLISQGVELEVVTAVPHYPGWAVFEGFRNRFSVERREGVRIVRCPLLLRREMRGSSRLLAPFTFAMVSAPVAVWRILRFRPDAVLCVEPTLASAPVAALAAKLVGARAVLHVQDLEVDAAFGVGHLSGDLLRRIALGVERAVLKGFDHVITISNRMREKLLEKGVPASRLEIVRNWVDLEKIKPMARSESRYRAELGLPAETFVALYAGNVGAKQALPIVLEAAAALAETRGLMFLIAGDGPEKKRLVADYGHLPNVRFLPVQPEQRLCELLNTADVHLLPQHSGAADLVLPSKLGGMLASGKPSIVMADEGTELHHFLRDAAVLIRSGDATALIGAINDVMAGRVAIDREAQLRAAKSLSSGSNLRLFADVLSSCAPAT